MSEYQAVPARNGITAEAFEAITATCRMALTLKPPQLDGLGGVKKHA